MYALRWENSSQARWLVAGLCLCVAGVISGCTRQEYVVEMEISEDGTASRNVVVTLASEGKGISKEERELIAGLYAGGKNDSDDKSIDVTASFKGNLPGDVGGSGRVVRYETSLGSVVQYRERFRSTHDFESLINKRLDAVDELCEFLADWGEAEAKDEQTRSDVRDFLTGQVRADLRNLALYVLFAQARGTGDKEFMNSEEFPARVLFFLSEHGYMTNEFLPHLNRGAGESSDGIKLVADILSLKYQVTHGRLLADDLPVLRTAQDAEVSLRQFAAKTPNVAKLAEGDPLEGMGKLMMRTIGAPMSDHDELTVFVKSESKPIETNGDWDEKSGEVSWEHLIEVPGNPVMNVIPAFCYASWSFPNDEAQRRQFGRVILKGQPLGEYVMWRNSLTVGESVDWKLFLLSLKPEDDLIKRVKEFQFETTDSSAGERQSLQQKIQGIFDAAIDNKE
ncbi:MAG: hypothetical protein R3C18_03045 [Planctomycetaceae bacterium]